MTIPTKQWTPEPWRRYPIPDAPDILSGGDGYVLCRPPSPTQNLEFWDANATRIVACVNALAGIANPAAIPGLIEAAKKVVADIEGTFGDVELVTSESLIGGYRDDLRTALSALTTPPTTTTDTGSER